MTEYKIDNPLPPGTRVYLPMVKTTGTIVRDSEEFYLVNTDVPVAWELAIADKWHQRLTAAERRLLEERLQQKLLLVKPEELEVIKERTHE